MMLQPTVADLTKGKINRYELAIATAKCARAITDEYLSQKELAEKAAAAGKDAEFIVTVDQVLADVKAVRVAIDNNKISTSLLQRKLSVGYGRAAKLIDQMEELEYVSAPDGNKPRRILITKERFQELITNGTLEG